MKTWRNRILETRLVSETELRRNPLNWRTHPVQQREALRDILEEVGQAAPLIAYYSEEADGALTLIDGHLRLDQGGEWSVSILDVNDSEAKLLLSVFDPITALAGADSMALDKLLEDVNTGSSALQDLLAEVADKAGLYQGDEDGEETLYDKPNSPSYNSSDENVRFLFGDYRGIVDHEVYESFIKLYREAQEESGEVLLSDVLESWLGL